MFLDTLNGVQFVVFTKLMCQKQFYVCASFVAHAYTRCHQFSINFYAYPIT